MRPRASHFWAITRIGAAGRFARRTSRIPCTRADCPCATTARGHCSWSALIWFLRSVHKCVRIRFVSCARNRRLVVKAQAVKSQFIQLVSFQGIAPPVSWRASSSERLRALVAARNVLFIPVPIAGFVGSKNGRFSFLHNVFRAAHSMRRVDVDCCPATSQSNSMRSAARVLLEGRRRDFVLQVLDLTPRLGALNACTYVPSGHK